MKPLNVTLEACLGGQLFTAVFATIDFWGAAVESHVTIENDFIYEGFSAELALVGLVAGVCRHVNSERTFSRQLPLTNRANPINAAVNFHMPVKS